MPLIGFNFFFFCSHTKQVKFKSKSAAWSQKSYIFQTSQCDHECLMASANSQAQILRDSNGAHWVGPEGHLERHHREPG